MNQKETLFKVGDKVKVGNREGLYSVLNFNREGNKMLVEKDGIKEWVYTDWAKLYESVSFIVSAIKLLISLFKKK